MPIDPRRRIAVAVDGDTAVVDTAADENHIPAANAAIDCDSLGDSQRTDYGMTPSETGNGTKSSLHNHSLLEPVVSSEKEGLENWKYNSKLGFHHGPPWSSSLES